MTFIQPLSNWFTHVRFAMKDVETHPDNPVFSPVTIPTVFPVSLDCTAATGFDELVC